MGRKAVSAAQKKVLVLKLLHERASFFKLDEIEKIADKEYGVVSNSVRGVLDELVSEGACDTDKIGSQTFFWALPSAGSAKRASIEASLDQRIADEKQQHEQLERRGAKRRSASSKDSGGRERKQRKITELVQARKHSERLQLELDAVAGTDPEHLAQLSSLAQTSLDAANRWTDNLYCMKSYVVNKMNCEKGVFNAAVKSFSDGKIRNPDEIDYVT